jgi:thymidylate kinase
LLTRAKERTLKEDRKFNEEKVKRIYSEYLAEKIEAKTFDADKNSSEEIAEMIFDLIH